MHKVHELKCWPEFFKEVVSGNKTFEIRKNDRDFKVGDYLDLREFDPKTCKYTKKSAMYKITYMLRGNYFVGMDDQFVTMSIVPATMDEFKEIEEEQINFLKEVMGLKEEKED